MSQTLVPMSSPDLTPAESEAVAQVLATRYLSLGPRLNEFEQQFAAYCGAQHGVGVNSGTSGLHLAVIACGIEAGDVVITTPFSFIASANCILYERAIPVFVDIRPDTLNIDPEQVAAAAAALADNPQQAKQWLPPGLRANPEAVTGRLKALLPVDAFGQPADYDPLRETARQHGLKLIADSCESIGAEYKGRRAGTLGDVSVFAFYPNKQMTTGEGGLIVTDDEHIALLCQSLRNQGRDVFNAWLDHTRLGYNYRLDEMSAALGLAQLDRLDTLLARRAQAAHWYNERLASMEAVQIPFIGPDTSRPSWFVYVIRLAPHIDRDAVMKELQTRGIPSRAYFNPIHLQTFYQEKFGYQPGDFPITERVARSTLSIPFFSGMTEAQVEQVCEALRESIAVVA